MWRDKANRVIADLCAESYAQANRGRKRHVPYAVPADAEALIECLRDDDELRAKNIFQRHAYGYVNK